MNRNTLSVLALTGLLGLTAATFLLAEGTAGPGVVAAVAVLKMAVIGGVFLELDRAHPAWIALGGVFLLGLGGGTTLLLGG